MIKFLLKITVFLLAFLGFYSLMGDDSQIIIKFYDFEIITTIFVFSILFLITQFLLTIWLKIFFAILNMPSIIKSFFSKRKIKKNNVKMVNIIAQLLMKKDEIAFNQLNKTINDINYTENVDNDVLNLVKAESATNINKKIEIYSKLLNVNGYSAYVAKELAKISIDRKNYVEAEQYASKAFNEDNFDAELLILLIRIYYNLNLWTKMVFVFSKLRRTNFQNFSSYKPELADYFYQAAQDAALQESYQDSIKYLESSLELKPDYDNALNLYYDLIDYQPNVNKIINFVKNAFKLSPSFGIAILYIKILKNSLKSTSPEIYNILTSIHSPEKNQGLFLSIASYLELDDELRQVKNYL